MRSLYTWIKRLPVKLGRITSSGVVRSEIDGLRFVALLFVFLWHFTERVARAVDPASDPANPHSPTASVVPDGYVGVLIFFSISAFVLLTQFKKNHGSLRGEFLKHYFMRRLMRLEPPYILLLTATYLFISLTGYVPQFTRTFASTSIPLGQSLVASIFYLHNIIFDSMPHLFNPGWSLEIEVQFYILAPFLFTLYTAIKPARWRLPVNLGVLLLSGGIAYYVGTYSSSERARFLFFTLVDQFEFFWIGVSAFELLSAKWFNGFWKPRPWAADLAAFAGIAGISLIASHALITVPWPYELGCFPFCIIGLFVGGVHGRWFRGLCTNPWIALLGGACYSLYLTHLQIVTLLTGALSSLLRPLSDTQMVICFALIEIPCVVAGGLVYYAFVERPFMTRDWPDRVRRFFARLLFS